MNEPISVEVRGGAGYVRYSEDPVASTVDVNETGSVAADVTESGAVVGIEVLDLVDRAQVQLAQSYASEKGLAFPRDLAGVLVGA